MDKSVQLEEEIQRLKSAVEELSVLNELALAAGSSLDTDQLLDTIVQKSLRAVNAEQGSILLVSEQAGDALKTLIRHQDHSRDGPAQRLGSHITGWVLKNRQPLVIDDLATDDRFRVGAAESAIIRTVLSVPIWHKARIIGILNVTNKKGGQKFSPGDLRLLSIIAAQSGQLIRNTRLQAEALEKKRLEYELNLAREIQLGLLPKSTPAISGWQIASHFDLAQSVGGDYFDFFEMGHQAMGVVLADVSGHGPAAALMMTMLKGILQATVQHHSRPDQILAELNRISCQIMPDDMFITMQLLLFWPDQPVILLSNAGHPPVIIFSSRSGRAGPFELRSCALNLSGQSRFNTRELQLGRHDFILLYTDGIIEACNENEEMFGMSRLLEILPGLAGQPADRIISGLLSEWKNFTGAVAPEDDRAIILLKKL